MDCSQCGLPMTERDGVYLCFCCGNHFVPPIPAPEYEKVVEICGALGIHPDSLIGALAAQKIYIDLHETIDRFTREFFKENALPGDLILKQPDPKTEARKRSRDDVAKKRKESRKRRGKP